MIVDRSPALISDTFRLQLALDIDDKIEGAGVRARALFCRRLVFPLPKEMRPEICFGISIFQRGQANEPRLIFSSD